MPSMVRTAGLDAIVPGMGIRDGGTPPSVAETLSKAAPDKRTLRCLLSRDMSELRARSAAQSSQLDRLAVRHFGVPPGRSELLSNCPKHLAGSKADRHATEDPDRAIQEEMQIGMLLDPVQNQHAGNRSGHRSCPGR